MTCAWICTCEFGDHRSQKRALGFPGASWCDAGVREVDTQVTLVHLRAMTQKYSSKVS